MIMCVGELFIKKIWYSIKENSQNFNTQLYFVSMYIVTPGRFFLHVNNMYKYTQVHNYTFISFQDLQTDQLDKIKELEKEVMVMRSKHSDTIQQLKSTFLAEKREYQQDSESRITALEKLANKVSMQGEKKIEFLIL